MKVAYIFAKLYDGHILVCVSPILFNATSENIRRNRVTLFPGFPDLIPREMGKAESAEFAATNSDTHE